jgi:hypothetical protein
VQNERGNLIGNNKYGTAISKLICEALTDTQSGVSDNETNADTQILFLPKTRRVIVLEKHSTYCGVFSDEVGCIAQNVDENRDFRLGYNKLW